MNSVTGKADSPAFGIAADRARPSSVGAAPRSDTGTIVIHWLSAAAMVASLLTGLRISADARTAVFTKWISPILPQGEVWTVHFIAGLGLFFSLTAYVIYMALSGLMQRNALRKTLSLTLPGSSVAARRARWGAVNVALHWFMYAIVLAMTGTGIALYLGFGGWVVWVHATCALISLGYIAVHVVTHFLYGGWWQLLRLFRPAKLAGAAASRRPLLIASIVGMPVIVGLAVADVVTRDKLAVQRVAIPPKLDALLEDAAWKTARPVYVRTMQGANFGGTGESTVSVRAVHDGAKIYFAFQWEDPTRSLRRVPMVKKADGWHLFDVDVAKADVVDYYEDKFAIMFSRSDAFGSGGSTHMGPRPLSDKPAPLNQRGLHYTTDGGIIDMWQWKASRGGLLGVVEDMYVGPPTEPTAAEASGQGRYQGGYWGDPGKSLYRYNYPFQPPGGYRGAVTPSVLPKDYKAMQAALGSLDPNPDTGNDENSRWWMDATTETIPYSKEADALIPVGTVMPGVIIDGVYTGDRAGIDASVRWADGHWTLIASRNLKTGSKHDIDFEPGSKVYSWVAAYDHTQTRHTRHMRPIEIELR